MTFKAVDNCVDILRSNGEKEQSCDGVLVYEDNLIFVELKDRGTQGWLTTAREQITVVFENFIKHHNIKAYSTIKAYACNKQRPLAVTSYNEEVQRFKDRTGSLLDNNGLILTVSRNIQIE